MPIYDKICRTHSVIGVAYGFLMVQIPADLTSNRIETIGRFYKIRCIPVPLVWPPNYNTID